MKNFGSRIAIFDCPLGIAGDMTVGALLDAGIPFDYFREQIAKLGLEGYRLRLEEVRAGAFRAKKFSVDLKKEKSRLGHHEHSHVSHHDDHAHGHTSLREIERKIRAAKIPAGAKQKAIRIFRALGRAEARVHGIGIQRVHFHEVGAIDSIIDIVGAAICLDYLKIKKAYVRSIAIGLGIHHGGHGVMPVPVPGAYDLLKGFTLIQTSYPQEMITPTGAAILSALCEQKKIPKFKLEAIGYGAGDRNFEGVRGYLRVSTGVC